MQIRIDDPFLRSLQRKNGDLGPYVKSNLPEVSQRAINIKRSSIGQVNLTRRIPFVFLSEVREQVETVACIVHRVYDRKESTLCIHSIHPGRTRLDCAKGLLLARLYHIRS